MDRDSVGGTEGTDAGPRGAASGGIESLLRRAVRAGRRLRDRWLHPARRRRSLARARAFRGDHVLVLCLGNICRSPYAAAVLDDRLESASVAGVRVSSAGFIGPGRPSPPTARNVARERGVDLSTHRSRVVTDKLARSADLVVVMEPAQKRRFVRRFRGGGARVLVLGDLDPAPVDRRAIPDPFNREKEVFRQTYARVERCVERLASALAQGRAGGGAGVSEEELRG